MGLGAVWKDKELIPVGDLSSSDAILEDLFQSLNVFGVCSVLSQPMYRYWALSQFIPQFT